jgi:DNA-binding response OmpR family regulator
MLKMNDRIRILFSSGYTADILRQKGLDEGGIDLVAKPFNPGVLTSKVRSVLVGDAPVR